MVYGSVKGCTRLDKISNHDMRLKLEIQKVTESNRSNRSQHFERLGNYSLQNASCNTEQ
jgi:hypothetical protein